MIIKIISLNDVLGYPNLSHRLLLELIENKSIQIIFFEGRAYVLTTDIDRAIPDDEAPIG
jgi:hypothetical protein